MFAIGQISEGKCCDWTNILKLSIDNFPSEICRDGQHSVGSVAIRQHSVGNVVRSDKFRSEFVPIWTILLGNVAIGQFSAGIVAIGQIRRGMIVDSDNSLQDIVRFDNSLQVIVRLTILLR